MILKEVKEPPKDGTQFVAIWTWGGNIWSDTFKYDGEMRLRYHNEVAVADGEEDHPDMWQPDTFDERVLKLMRYFVKA